MLPILMSIFRKLQLRLYKRSIGNALALHRRNEVRSDGLSLDTVCNRLEICWHARDLHPWDDGLSPGRRESTFHQQAMEDIEAAVHRIFERRPEVEVIEIRVLHPHSNALLASGAVQRSAPNVCDLRSPSVRMRLGELGIRYFFTPSDPGTSGAEPGRSVNSGDLDHRSIA